MKPKGRTFQRMAPVALFIVLLAAIPGRAAGELTIAAAADLQFAMRALIQGFERQSGVQVRLVAGSSGNLATEIEHGAPFDLFFSADVQHPEQLVRDGAAEPGTLVRYALGRLVVYVPADSPLDFDRRGLAALENTAVRKIAIANPRFAPYGAAAAAALRHAGLYGKLQSRLVLGEDVSQATQFVVSGNAQAALTSLALMLAPGAKPPGRYWLVPPEDYPPLDQAAVIVKRSGQKQLARAFLAYLETAEARSIFRRYGFAPPEKTP
ncbi:MAG TPA: molybdate ABC transporter substrate-binding protein [Patescibacteria group bacterium]|nr:molybdate ABC transporter substrate-binding protein [Patescibacteria group bacterium]